MEHRSVMYLRALLQALRQALPQLARLGAVCFLGLLCACGKVVDLQSGLNDIDANEIVTVLNRHGIEAQKRASKEGVVLAVKDGDIARATDVMRAAGLPRRARSDLGTIFKKEGMISTPLEERVRYIHGLSAELESTLLQFDRVVAARVHVVLPERIAPGEPIQPSSAAVFVKYLAPLDEDTVVPRIRNMVASSIPGLGGDEGRRKVTVVLTPSELSAPAVEWTTVGPFRVMSDSADGLGATLLALLALGLAGVVLGLLTLARRHAGMARWLDRYSGKEPVFLAEADDDDDTPAAGGAQR
ncbi:type III secretion system inner membrane ring lipoprotein SctJ [Rugamonas sp. CCM 8940]|uniref:type III secretion system inner membrane ring lipoprotein SctJ n=2 Tax=Rugamonas sp. CCM 8940 TaxID=2765359 RepID=UPI001F4802FC|nr:type III secretion inner membrane ring lipoprotein SctJ [Rugamonas sp. CCM 8940]